MTYFLLKIKIPNKYEKSIEIFSDICYNKTGYKIIQRRNVHMKKVQITETVLRDANQSLMATRLPYSDYEDILSDMNKAGYSYST